METATGLDQGSEMNVNVVMVPVEQGESGLNARLDTLHCREIVNALDAMVAVEVLKERLQGGDQDTKRCARFRSPITSVRHGIAHFRQLVPEFGMHSEPMPGDRVEVGPAIAREGVSQIQVFDRQAAAQGERRGVEAGVRQRRLWS
ncbi:MAG: hypothetical protein Q8J81_00080 [Phenylobacterium sp.]|nr:hypothetical protein [Phenylobacterium sp.]MDP2212225.1 hypothetical protein [Phenylobacterium sp.]